MGRLASRSLSESCAAGGHVTSGTSVYCCPVRLPLHASSYPHLDIEESVLLILAAEPLIH